MPSSSARPDGGPRRASPIQTRSIIASPMPTKTRATTPAPKVLAKAKANWPAVIRTTPVNHQFLRTDPGQPGSAGRGAASSDLNSMCFSQIPLRPDTLANGEFQTVADSSSLEQACVGGRGTPVGPTADLWLFEVMHRVPSLIRRLGLLIHWLNLGLPAGVGDVVDTHT